MKAQTKIFQEVLNFAIGIGIVISVIFIFTGILTPKVVEKSSQAHMKNILTQIEAYFVQINDLDNLFPKKIIEVNVKLPEKINGRDYDIYVQNKNLCVVLSNIEKQYCKTPSFKLDENSFYFSGSDMILTKNEKLLSFSN